MKHIFVKTLQTILVLVFLLFIKSVNSFMKIIHKQPAIATIVLVLSLCTYTTQAQTKEATKTKEPTHRSVIKLNLVAPADFFVFPTIQLSYERKLSKRISIAGEFGYQFYQMPDRKINVNDNFAAFTTNSDTSFISPKGIKANIECRYYFLRLHHPHKTEFGIYAGANLSYRWDQTDVAIVYLKDSITRMVDCYWIQRMYWGGMAVIGHNSSWVNWPLKFIQVWEERTELFSVITVNTIKTKMKFKQTGTV